MSSTSSWSRFSSDPRAHGQLRASDQDRIVLSDILSEAYAQGQIDAEEFDERFDTAERVKTLGEIPALIEDLVLDAELTDESAVLVPAAMSEDARAKALARLDDEQIPITPEQIDTAARKYYRTRVRRAVIGMVAGPFGLTLAIWVLITLLSGSVGFFWPVFVLFPAVGGALSQIVGRERVIAQRKKVLTERAKARLGDAEAQLRLEERQRRKLDGIDTADDDIGDIPYFPGRMGAPHPLSPGHHPSSRDEARRRRRELRNRRRYRED